MEVLADGVQVVVVAGANQTAIPIIQVSEKDLVQIQQNINKVLRNLNNQIVDLQTQVSQLGVLGEIRFSALTLAQWQAETSTDWILANGQSSVGTIYANRYSLNTVPNISVSGTNAYIKVNG